MCGCGQDLSLPFKGCANCGYGILADSVPGPPPSETEGLAVLTNGWTMPGVVRQYSNKPDGHASFAREVEVFGLHGYSPTTQSTDSGHVHVGPLLMTGSACTSARRSSSAASGSPICT